MTPKRDDAGPATAEVLLGAMPVYPPGPALGGTTLPDVAEEIQIAGHRASAGLRFWTVIGGMLAVVATGAATAAVWSGTSGSGDSIRAGSGLQDLDHPAGDRRQADLPGAPSRAGAPSGSGGASPSASGSAGPSQVPAAVAATPPAARFAATAGEDCPITTTSGFTRTGQYLDWYQRYHGGWTSDGCGGDAVAVPMSGDAAVDDPDNVVVWWFKPDNMSSGSCSVSVFVPDTGIPMDAAGAPAHYIGYASTAGSGTAIGEFDIDQTAHRGEWAVGGTLPLRDGQLSIRLATRGEDWGSGRIGAHLGVSAARVDCEGR